MHKLVHHQRDRVISLASATFISLTALTPASGNVRFFIFTRIRVSNAHTLITFPPRLLVYGARTPGRQGAVGRWGTRKRRKQRKGRREERKGERDRRLRNGRMADLTRSRGRLSISCSSSAFSSSRASTRQVLHVITADCKYFLIKPSSLPRHFLRELSYRRSSTERSLSIDISDITCGDIATAR